jgi:hypothetical protein
LSGGSLHVLRAFLGKRAVTEAERL